MLEAQLAGKNELKVAEAQLNKPEPTASGFRAFLEELKSHSGTMTSGGKKSGGRYTAGPLRGKTLLEAVEYARLEWEKLSYDEKMIYERRAEQYSSMYRYLY